MGDVRKHALAWALAAFTFGAASPLLADPPAPDHGTVAGVVLDDVTGLPLAGASAVIGSSSAVITDVRGRYVLAASGSSPVLVVSKSEMTTVERPVVFAAGVNVVPVDARLTALGSPTTVTTAGGALQSGAVTVTVPAGAVGTPTSCRLTALSAQGLPGLLPLGWSSLAAFDLRATGVAMPLATTVGGLPAGASGLALASYDKTQHAWTLVDGAIAAGGDGVAAVSVSIASATYAIVVPDTSSLLPAIGQPLAAADLVTVPDTATVSADVNPPSLPASGNDGKGATAQVTLRMPSSVDLPSGTVIAAAATESFTLASGAKGAEEQRQFDVLMYRNPAPAAAGLTGTIPVTPERTFLDAEFASGSVKIDLYAGREGVRGRVSDGSAEEVDDEDVQLLIPAGALPAGTSILLEQAATLSSFLPSSSTLQPLAELFVDFSGQTLGSAAQLGVATGPLSPSDTFLVARVDRYEGVPYLTVVSRAQVSGDSVVSMPTAGLPGIVAGGRYVLYRSSAPVGFVAGTTAAVSGPVQSLVQGNNLPFIGLANANGSYIMAALAGSVSVTARVPGTAIAGGAAVAVTANQTAALDVALAGQATLAAVAPANGATLVPISAQATITVPVALQASTVTAGNVALLQGGATVTTHFQLAGNGKTLAIIPDAPLAFSTSYTLQATGLADVQGAAVVVPATTFTTAANTPPAMHPELLTFSFPDANGLVTLSAPDGSFPPGSTIFVVDADNGGILSTSVGNQGGVAPLMMLATINDEMVVTITDPLNNTITFKRSQYEDVAGGRTAVGAGGGVVRRADGLELRIPRDALSKGIIFKLEDYVMPEGAPKPRAFTTGLPATTTGAFGGAVKITVNEKVKLNGEAKLAFLVPALPAGAPATATPSDAFYYVVQHTTTPQGKAAFKLLDHAFVEGVGADARVVTASPPYPGVDEFEGVGYYSMWETYDTAQPGRSMAKAISGKVVRPVMFGNTAAGQGATTTQAVPNVTVSVVDATGLNALAADGGMYAVTQTDGRFMLIDNMALGGTYQITAAPMDDAAVTATLYDATPFEASAPALSFYSHVLTANVTLPAKVPPMPPPVANIKLFENKDQTAADGMVTPARGLPVNGYVVLGTPLYVGVTLKRGDDGQPIGRVTSVTVSTAQATTPLKLGNDATVPRGSPDAMDYMAPFQPFVYGVNRVTATVLPPIGDPITFSYTFSVITQGGRNLVGLPDSAPEVITQQTLPVDGALSVPTDVAIQISFTEPVTNVFHLSNGVGTVQLVKLGATPVPVDFTMSGTGVDGSGNQVVYDPLTNPILQDRLITGLTLRPKGPGLDYSTQYRVTLAPDIVDTDTPPKHLAPYTLTFTTYDAAAAASGGITAAAGIAVLGNRAYQTHAGISGPLASGVDAYDISDASAAPAYIRFDDRPDLQRSSPDKPFNLFAGQPRDIVAELDTPGPASDTGRVLGRRNGRYVVVATGPWTQSLPGNLNLFDVTVEDHIGDSKTPSGIQTNWRGGVSLTLNPVDGWIARTAVKDGVVYAATNRKGIQLVDLAQVVKRWPSPAGDGNNYSAAWENMWTRLNSDGIGYGADLVDTMPLCPLAPPASCEFNPSSYTFGDIKVGDYTPGRLAVAVGGDPALGSKPLLIADRLRPPMRPYAVQGLVTSYDDPQHPQTSTFTLRTGTALALGDVTETATGNVRKVAVVVGDGQIDPGTGPKPGRMLVVLDMGSVTTTAGPTFLGALALDDKYGVDLALWNNEALVSGKATTTTAADGTVTTQMDTAIISLSDLQHPHFAGKIGGVGGDLAVGTGDVDGMIYGSVRARFSEADPLGGIKTAAIAGDPTCPLAKLTTDPIMLVDMVDPATGAHEANDVLAEFSLCRDAVVKIDLLDKNETPTALSAKLDAATVATDFSQPLLLGAGTHVLALPPGVVDRLRTLHHLRVAATDAATGNTRGPGKNRVAAIPDIQNRAVLPVGRTFVKGVDLYDGHLALSAVDIKVPGRHLSLETTRSYSSAGNAIDSVLGPSWAWNYASSITKAVGDVFSVSTPDGSSVRFKKDDTGYKAQLGYHGTLEPAGNAGDGFVFTDKSNVKFYYEPVGTQQTNASVRRWRLLKIVDPHDDRIELTYAKETEIKGLVTSISEYHGSMSLVALRTLNVIYFRAPGDEKAATKINGYYRIDTIEEPNLHYRVKYEYDPESANLLHVTVYGDYTDQYTAPRSYTYTYFPYDAEDWYQRHYQVHVVEGPNDKSKTEYVYYDPNDSDTPDAGVYMTLGRQESVKEVWEYDGIHDQPFKTTFDYSHVSDGTAVYQSLVTVTDSRGKATKYTLDKNGSPWIIEQLGPATTQLQWATNDIHKDWEKDPLNRKTTYDSYDTKGNLTSETIDTTTGDGTTAIPGTGIANTTYHYDPIFSKLDKRTDAEGGITQLHVNGQGDIDWTRDAEDNLTQTPYDSQGRLLQTQDPRNNVTTVTAWDPFDYGLPQTLALPAGTGGPAVITYDPRGRKTTEDDGRGHVVDYVYDGHDQVISTRHRLDPASQGPDDVVTTTKYYPSGQVHETHQTGKGTDITRTYGLDWMGRVTSTTIAGNSPDGNVTVNTSASYDGNGNKVGETDARGIVHRYEYDDLNRLWQVWIDSAPSTMGGPKGVEITEYEYDKAGHKTAEIDKLTGARTEFHYDALYRVDQKTLPAVMVDGASTHPIETYGYDKVGNRKDVFDANHHQTHTDYDKLGRVTNVRDAANNTVATSYVDPDVPTAKVNKTSESSSNGRSITYGYDAANRENLRIVSGPGLSYPYVTTTQITDPVRTVTVTDTENGLTLGVNVTEFDGAGRATRTTVGTTDTAVNLVTQVAYDGLGNKTSVIDPRTNTTQYKYDGIGRLKTVIDPLINQTSYGYDGGSSLKTQEIDRRNVVKHMTYDTLGRLTGTQVDGNAGMSNVAWTQSTQYLDAEFLQKVTTNGKLVTNTVDALGRVVTVADSDGTHGYVRALTYDAAGNKKSEQDRLGNITTYDYDNVNRLTYVHDPAPFTSQYVQTTYLDTDRQKTVRDRRGIVTTTQMDALGRVMTVSRDGTIIETNFYDGRGRKTTTKDGENHTTTFVYDAADRLKTRTDGLDAATRAVTNITYPDNGGTVKEQDRRAASIGANVFSSTKTYDALGRLYTEKNGEDETTTYNYDAEGNKNFVQENTGPETRFAYDELGKLLSVTQPANGSGGPVFTKYDYDADRNRIRQTDPNNHVVEMKYDDFGRMTELHQDPLGLNLVTKHEYDGNGNEKVLTDPKLQTVTTSYDNLNRPILRLYGLGSGSHSSQPPYLAKVTYDIYDENGNLKQLTEQMASGDSAPSGSTVTVRNYDSFDRLHSETVNLPIASGDKTVTYNYFNNGTREMVKDSYGDETHYTYDDQSRLNTVTTQDGGVTHYGYYPDGLTQTVSYPNGVLATSSYDKADRLTQLVNSNGSGGSVISKYVYEYNDGRGNRTKQVETNGGLVETTQYGYDDLNRLASVTYPSDTDFPNGRIVSYTYDNAGNRTGESTKDASTQQVLNNKIGTFDQLNRLQALSDFNPAKSVTFGYDADGNTTSKTVGGVTTTYAYDVRDRQVQVSQGSSILGSYEYDADGRLRMQNDETIKYFVYDQTSRFQEFASTGDGIGKYDYGVRLIRLTEAGEGGATADHQRYYSYDGLGSATALTDSLGAPKANLHLDVWGVFRKPSELDSTLSRVGFTGYFWSKSTNLYFAKARWYDPETARFTTQDSFLGKIDAPPSLHRYFYANDNPTRFIDPTGHIGRTLRQAQEWEKRHAAELKAEESRKKWVEAWYRELPRRYAAAQSDAERHRIFAESIGGPMSPFNNAANAVAPAGTAVVVTVITAGMGAPLIAAAPGIAAGPTIVAAVPAGAVTTATVSGAAGFASAEFVRSKGSGASYEEALDHARIGGFVGAVTGPIGEFTGITAEATMASRTGAEGQLMTRLFSAFMGGSSADATGQGIFMWAGYQRQFDWNQTLLSGLVSAAAAGASGPRVPRGVSLDAFNQMGDMIGAEARARGLGTDVVVQGSTARPEGVPWTPFNHKEGSFVRDIDIAILVDDAKFDQLIKNRWPNPNVGSNNWKSMQKAIANGKIWPSDVKMWQGDKGLSALRDEISALTGMEVDLSIVRKGGRFDNVGPTLRVPVSSR